MTDDDRLAELVRAMGDLADEVRRHTDEIHALAEQFARSHDEQRGYNAEVLELLEKLVAP